MMVSRFNRRFVMSSFNRVTSRTPLGRPTCRLPCRSVSSASSGENDQQQKSPQDAHEEFMKQTQELNDERQALFGFTPEEEHAWGSAKVHSSSLMDAVKEARRSDAAATRQKHHHDTAAPDYRQEEAVEQSFPSKSLKAALYQDNVPEELLLFSHVDSKNAIHMVDVGPKVATRRVARARSSVVFPPEVMAAFSVEKDDLVGPKGPIFATAQLAGIMAAKRTSDLIPLCHPLPLDKVHVDIRLEGNTAIIECECRVTHKTGVEMEALTGASIAALTIYDMVKAVSHRVTIQETVLLYKTGGKRNVEFDKSFESTH